MANESEKKDAFRRLSIGAASISSLLGGWMVGWAEVRNAADELYEI